MVRHRVEARHDLARAVVAVAQHRREQAVRGRFDGIDHEPRAERLGLAVVGLGQLLDREPLQQVMGRTLARVERLLERGRVTQQDERGPRALVVEQ